MIDAKDIRRVGSASEYSKELQNTLLQLQRQIVSLKDAVPVGTVVDWMGQPDDRKIPGGWIFCDGRELSRVTYRRLYETISTAFGVGDGETTFNVPNFNSKIAKGVPLGTAANVLTGQTVSEIVDLDLGTILTYIYVTKLIKAV